MKFSNQNLHYKDGQVFLETHNHDSVGEAVCHTKLSRDEAIVALRGCLTGCRTRTEKKSAIRAALARAEGES